MGDDIVIAKKHATMRYMGIVLNFEILYRLIQFMSKINSCFFVAVVGVSLFCASLANGQTASPLDRSNTQTSNIQETIDGILRDFCNQYSLPGGVSMAISYREKLVYAGAIGYADKEHKIPLTPEHRMRIASLSKPITAIAIMKLEEEKKLNLNDEVFGETGIFKGEYGIPELENCPVKITIKQLLEHTTGGWGNSKNDPMFSIPRNVARKEFMRTVIRERPLENPPGTKHDYSNFGYWVLGRVIEKQSGMTYEDYVKENILMSCGISGMRIGGNVSASDEVEYIGDGRQRPYTLSPHHMDAHGGWVANPIELLKLLVRVDGFSTVQDILRSETITTMTTPSKQSPNYALGWVVNRSNNWWHMGGMPGTSAEMARSSEVFNWVILVNSRPDSAPEFSGDMDKLFWQIKSTVRTWPTGIALDTILTIPVLHDVRLIHQEIQAK